MTKYKALFCAFFLLSFIGTTNAQTSTNSPYTRYGFGQLSDQNFGNSIAMGGISYGLRNGLQVNASNPASYSAVDSLTFIFDFGMSLQNTNFQEGSVKTNAKNSTVDYIAMQYRLYDRMGMSIGFLPYSNVGYTMMRTNNVTADNSNESITSATQSFSGEGGLQQVYVGLGYKLLDNFSIGANFSYLYGTITHTVGTIFNNSSAFSSSRSHRISVNDYKLDFGLQYTQKLGEKRKINIGAVYSLGHDLNSTGYEYVQKYTNSGSIATQTVDTIPDAFAIPHTYGAGITYVYDDRLTIGVDYTLQKWQDAKFFNEKGAFENRTKIAMGAEYLPNPLSNNLLKRIRYRAGAYYSSPYAKVNGNEGNKEYGVSFGFGLPVIRSKSILNISGQYVKVTPKIKGMLEETYLRINVGLTFNERWFMKWKVD